MGHGCLKPYLPPSPTKSMSVKLMTLFGAFVSITSHSTALLASSHTPSHDVILWYSTSLAVANGGGCSTRLWAITSSLWREQAKRSWHSKGLTQSNGHAPSCHLGQQVVLQPSSTYPQHRQYLEGAGKITRHHHRR